MNQNKVGGKRNPRKNQTQARSSDGRKQGGARHAQPSEAIADMQPASLLLAFEESQLVACGLLQMLSDALGARESGEDAGVGISMVADEVQKCVEAGWRALSDDWNVQRETDFSRLKSMETLPPAISERFDGLITPLQCASALVHSQAFALSRKTLMIGDSPADGLYKGFDVLARNWARAILKPCDMLERYRAYLRTAPAAASNGRVVAP